MTNYLRFFCLLVVVLLTGISGRAQSPDFSLVGFAENTTGGSGGATVIVKDYSTLKIYAESNTPAVIIIDGTIANGADGGSINIHSNKTILGSGNGALMFGVGFTIKGYNNIIIRNIRFTMTGVTTRVDKSGVYSSTGDEGRPQILKNGGDCIRLMGDCFDVWIDHCEFFNEDPAVQTNIDLYDGIVDITGTSYNVTLSWNYVHDHHKVHLVGSSDTDLSDRRVTMHHNYFYNVRGRLPFYRYGTGHVFNNYYNKCSTAVNSRMQACLLVEKNYFENVSSNTIFDTGSLLPGYATLNDNLFVNSKSPLINSCNSFIPAYNYSGVLTNTEDVKRVVMAYAGVGIIITSVAACTLNKAGIERTGQEIFVTNRHVSKLLCYSTTGILVRQTNNNRMDIAGLSHGIYLLRFFSEENTAENLTLRL